MTFTIVAYVPLTDAWAVAVASKFVALGTLTPWVMASVNAIATEAWINTTQETGELELFACGLPTAGTITQLIGEDQGLVHRQVGMIGDRGYLNWR